MEQAIENVDVAILGGGPAGMQAALVLSRTRKSVVVFDDPHPPRNAASHGVHNFVGLDGMLPADIRKAAWKQINVYGTAREITEGIVSVRRNGSDGFVVAGADGKVVTAQHVIVAVGYHDIYPDVPGFSECWGDSVIQCPFCDGYENRDRVWGIVTCTHSSLAVTARLARNWTNDIKVIAPDADRDAQVRQELSDLGVAVHPAVISEIHHSRGKVEAVTLETGEVVEVQTLWWTPDPKPSPLIRSLVDACGLEVDEEGTVVTDDGQKTNVDGLWAAGDVAGSSGAIEAAAGGWRAALSIVRGWYAGVPATV